METSICHMRSVPCAVHMTATFTSLLAANFLQLQSSLLYAAYGTSVVDYVANQPHMCR